MLLSGILVENPNDLFSFFGFFCGRWDTFFTQIFPVFFARLEQEKQGGARLCLRDCDVT